MNKKELEQKLIEIDAKLAMLGDINSLVVSANEKKQEMESLISSIKTHEETIDAIPKKRDELNSLIQEVSELNKDVENKLSVLEVSKDSLNGLNLKAAEIQQLSLDQLGVISNEKLSNSFDKVTDNLKTKNVVWFQWLVGTSMLLMLAIIGIVIWQTLMDGTIFEIGFLVKLSLTSPIIFFEFFINREYSRSQRLIEEYEFKASIARSLEAYKEIIENLFSDRQDGEDYKKKLDFILGSIGQLYTSPMKNIKDNELNDALKDKALISLISELRESIKELKKLPLE